MVYYFDLADTPNDTLGSADVYMGQYDWFSARPVREKDGLAEDWMKELYPTSVTVDPADYKLHDVLKTQGMFCISGKLMELIESLEANTHQFLPIQVKYGDEQHDYYILKFGISEDCYDLEQSDIKWEDLLVPAGMDPIKVWKKKYKVPLVFLDSKITNKHLWQNKSGEDMKLMSGELYSLCIKESISGLKFEKQIVAKDCK